MSGAAPDTVFARALPLLDRLVAFDTTSHRSNLEAIAFIRERLEAAGARCRLTGNDEGTKANLCATLGPDSDSGLLLSGHTDVVPADPADWSGDPFRLAERDGRLHGRGTADMKGFIALCLALLPELAPDRLARPIHFAFSYDEEIGCIGVRRLIADLANLPARPRLCLVGEPTGLKPISGHKGRRSMICHVHGREAHSALDAGVNAIEAAAKVIGHIAAIQAEFRREGPFDPASEPPYTTLTTGVIAGGRALNITPRDCRFEFEIRALPGIDVDAIEARILAFARDRVERAMKAVDPATFIAFATTNDTPGFVIPDDHELVGLVASLTGGNAPGRVGFCTEAGLFTRAGIPTLVCGPGHIDQAHKPDEFISRDQLARGADFLAEFTRRVCF